jgi:hypothetical protein
MKSGITNTTDINTQKKCRTNEQTSAYSPSDSTFTQRKDINYHTRGYTPGAKDSTPKPTPPPFKTGSSVSKPIKSNNN